MKLQKTKCFIHHSLKSTGNKTLAAEILDPTDAHKNQVHFRPRMLFHRVLQHSGACATDKMEER